MQEVGGPTARAMCIADAGIPGIGHAGKSFTGPIINAQVKWFGSPKTLWVTNLLALQEDRFFKVMQMLMQRSSALVSDEVSVKYIVPEAKKHTEDKFIWEDLI